MTSPTPTEASVTPSPGVFPPRGQALAACLKEKLAQVQITTDRYPFFYLEDFFPADYYQEILACKPSKEQLVCIDELGRTSGYKDRYIYELSSNDLGVFNERQRAEYKKDKRPFLCHFTLSNRNTATNYEH